MPRNTVLVVSSSNLSPTSVTELSLHQTLSYLRESTVHRLVLATKTHSEAELLSKWEHLEVIPHKLMPYPVTSSIGLAWARIRLVPQILRQIGQYARKHNIHNVTIVLSAIPLYSVCEQLLESGEYNVSCLVWDPPELLCRNLRLDPVSTADAMRSFDRCMRGSTIVATVSKPMAETYKHRYRANTCVITSGVAPSPIARSSRRANESETLKLGFCGSLYAKDCWNSLVTAISSVDSTLQGRQIQIDFAGHFPMTGVRDRAFVRKHGRISYDSAIALLRSADICYLPYSFETSFETAARLCFPGKLAAYVCSGRPILYHGPEYGSPTGIIADYKLGVACHTTEPVDLLASIEKCLELRESHRSLSDGVLAFSADYFGDETAGKAIRRTFWEKLTE